MSESNYRLLLTGVLFTMGFMFVLTRSREEGFANRRRDRCPNVLVKDGCRYYLYNTREDKVPGVNPIEFEHLEDYVEFVDWLRSRNVECPVLHLEKTFSTQGETVYHTRPSPTQIAGARPERPSRCCPSNKYKTASSASGIAVQDDDRVDDDQSRDLMRYDAMDPGWQGVASTRNAVASGLFSGNDVSIMVQEH